MLQSASDSFEYLPLNCGRKILILRFRAGSAMLHTKQRDASADISALERETDELVYALYGLTPEEIKLVEESVKP